MTHYIMELTHNEKHEREYISYVNRTLMFARGKQMKEKGYTVKYYRAKEIEHKE